MTNNKLVIDPGHGGNDPGATGIIVEKEINLTLSLKLADRLNKSYNADILLTRESDTTVSLSDRSRMANDFNANFFLSLHSNAGGGAGYEDYVFNGVIPHSTFNKRHTFHSNTSGVWIYHNRPNRGKKAANFHVLRETRMAAVLAENGFVDNSTDAALLTDKDFQDLLVKGMAQGIVAILGLDEVEATPPVNNNNGLWINQVGAFKYGEYAQHMATTLEQKKFDSYVYRDNGFWKVQAGAFKSKDNADRQAKALKDAGFNVWTYQRGK